MQFDHTEYNGKCIKPENLFCHCVSPVRATANGQIENRSAAKMYQPTTVNSIGLHFELI